MLECLTARQLNDWYNYNEIEPFGEYRNELRHGQQMALFANVNRNTKKKPEPFIARDFMNFVEIKEEPEKELTTEELEAYAERIFGV
jgi:hypothetical protein